MTTTAVLEDDDGERLYAVSTVCKRLALSRKTVYELMNRGDLKYLTFKGVRGRRVKASVLEAFIAGLKAGG